MKTLLKKVMASIGLVALMSCLVPKPSLGVTTERTPAVIAAKGHPAGAPVRNPRAPVWP